jgi:predicted dehydrogenase
VCDLSPVLAEATAEELGCGAWFTDHAALLREVRPSVVHVTTPPATHFRLALDALEAGAHVLVEKPITHEADELAQLLARAKERGRLLVEDHNYMFNPPVQQLLAHMASGRLGRVLHVEVSIALAIAAPGSRYVDPNLPNPWLSLPGGAIGDFLTHLAYLAFLFVGPHRAVRTLWRKLDPKSPLPCDEFRALVDAERGTAALSFSSHAQPDAFVLRVHGTKARAQASLFEPLLAVERLRGGPRPLMPVANGLSGAAALGGAGLGGLWRKLSGRPVSYAGLHELVARLYRAVEKNGEPPVSRRQIEEVRRLVADLSAEAPRA